MADNVYVSVLT